MVKKWTLLMAMLLVAGCGSVDSTPPELIGRNAVAPVVTEHSMGLQCLGDLIDDAGFNSVIIDVDRIRDRTIPIRLNDPSRLAQAGEWFIHTAISKLESERVRSRLHRPKRNNKKDMQAYQGESTAQERELFTISGAWTQDDQLYERADGGLNGEIGRFNFETGGTFRHEFIAGDFTTSIDGVVTFASAIGVVLSDKELQAKLLVENGGSFAEVGFERRWVDGPQLAQRRIAEAATLVHVANYYGIDYQPCLETGWSNPQAFRKSLADYRIMTTQARHQAVLDKLRLVGVSTYDQHTGYDGSVYRGLMRYQSIKKLPITGRISAVTFALLSADAERQKSRPKNIAHHG